VAGQPVFQVEGGPELRRTLRRAGDDLTDLKEAHARAAQIVTPAAQAGAPHRTGRLAATVRGAGQKTAALIRAGYASVPYAGVIEWGWPARSIVAQAFIGTAARATETTWREAYLAQVQDILDRVKGA